MSKDNTLQNKVIAREEQLIRKARVDFDTFCEYVLQDDEGEFIKQAPIHRLWTAHYNWCADNDKFCTILAPWGHGKTEQLAIGRVLFMLGQNPQLRIKIVCNTDLNARGRLAAIKKYIETSKELQAVFPYLKADEGQKWTQHELFIIRKGMSKDASVQAFGILASGIGGRADVLIFDDIQDYRNAVLHPALRIQVINVTQHVWMSRLDAHPDKLNYCPVIYVATPWHEKDVTSIYVKATERFYLLEVRISDDLSKMDCQIGGDDETKFNIPLWEKFNEEKIIQKRAEMATSVFNAGFHLKLISEDDLLLRSFKRCLNYEETPKDIMNRIGGSWRIVTGMDISGKQRAGNVLFTLAANVNTHDRVPLDIRVGGWTGSDMIRQLFEVYDLYQPDTFAVENNGVQGQIIDLISDEDIVSALSGGQYKDLNVVPFHTNINKADLDAGIPGMETEFHNGMWHVGLKQHDHRDKLDCKCVWCRYVNEVLLYPTFDTTDVLMSSWFAREQVRSGRTMRQLLGAIFTFKKDDVKTPKLEKEMRPVSVRKGNDALKGAYDKMKKW